MRPVRFCALVLAAGCAFAIPGPGCAAKKSRTPVTAGMRNLSLSPEELRIRVRALIRPTIGTVEEAADRGLAEIRDPAARREILVWKIETTASLLSAMLRVDPVLALADTWTYALQVKDFLARDATAERYGAFAPIGIEALERIERELERFVRGVQSGLDTSPFEDRVHEWARKNPIEGALYRRPSVDTAVAQTMSASIGGGALAALGSLEETMADAMARMDLYTMYLPRLARWEAELGIDDVAGGIDSKGLVSEVERFTRAADRLAALAERTPEVVAQERTIALDALRAERIAATRDLQAERRSVVDALHEERVATLQELEAIVVRIVDRASGPLHAAAREDARQFLASVEAMRRRLIVDAGAELVDAVDHAFVKAVELLLIAAALGALAVLLLARFVRR